MSEDPGCPRAFLLRDNQLKVASHGLFVVGSLRFGIKTGRVEPSLVAEPTA
jgi:hypothetical protein